MNDPFMTGNHQQEFKVKQYYSAVHARRKNMLSNGCKKERDTKMEMSKVKHLLTSDLDLFLHIHPSREQDISSPSFYLQ